MTAVSLSAVDLALAACLVLLLALISHRMALGVAHDLLVAAARTAIQLTLVGMLLKLLFEDAGPVWVVLMALAMLAIAGREVWARQKHPLRGVWGYGLGAGAMFVSCFTLVIFALLVLVQPVPWYQPQYAIPLLGMLLGNTMNAIALGVDRMNRGAINERNIIEARLALGDPAREATAALRRDAVRVALVPMINAMAAAGVVSLPGMMTGQILAGAPPLEAVKYQILIMFLITAATGLGALWAVETGAKRLFDDRERLRIDRLRN